MSPVIRDIKPISKHRYLVAESPVWDDRRHCAFFVDVKGHLLGAYAPETGAITPLMRGEVQTEADDDAVFTTQIDHQWSARSVRFGAK